MTKKDGIIYFDERRCGIDGKLAIDFSFALNTETHEVIYSKSGFLEEIKEYLEGKRKSNLVSLDVYYDKDVFDRLIREMLGLEGNGYMMDHRCYVIPETLTLEDFNKMYDYDLVYSTVNNCLDSMSSWYRKSNL